MTRTKLSQHFYLDELLPAGVSEDEVPPDVQVCLEMLVEELLEPLREALGMPLRVHSGYRPPVRNAAVGGKTHSDHLTGNAADFHVDAGFERTWQESTIFAFHFLRTQFDGRFGQLILEDHRTFYHNPAKFWIHVSNPTTLHPGTPADKNRILLSSSPTSYAVYEPNKAPTE